MTRVLVTGVAGFIGSHVAEQCLRLGFEVMGVDDLSGGFLANVPVGVDFRRGSVVDADWVAGLWTTGNFDYVYHLAAYAAEGLSHFIRRFNYQTNLIGSINLINQAALHGVKCLIFTSSIAVYGAHQNPLTEELTPHPEDPYGISKYAVELDLAAAHRLFDLPYIIFRPHNVYGERQNIADKYRNVIGIFMNQALQGRPLTIFGDGLQTRAFSYIDDVAPIIARAPLVPDAYQQVFNIGADQPYSVLALARATARAMTVEPDIVHLPPRQEVVHAFASHAKAQAVFQPPVPVPLSEGLTRMAQWARLRGPMTPVDFERIEVALNLPPSWAKQGSPA
ncbi:MAG: NAD-dependent epimerase/dehydratase family protein [Chloroflexi bacterium]|nr:NAD-dependent epimerase/dehydratase family protein [Chloroflexota bacterium]